MPITKMEVERLHPNSILWDAGRGSVAGFGARRQRRNPVFILKYAIGGRQRWHTIGRFGSPWTVENARSEAKRLLGELAAGKDPKEQRRDAEPVAAGITVAELCDQYLEAAKGGGVLTRFNRPKRSSTLAIDVGRIDRHIKPLIGTMAVTAVDSRAVKKIIQDITIGKTAADIKTKQRGRALVKGGPATAARVADLLSGIMTWAVDEEIVSVNPVHGIRRYRGEPRDRFLSEVEMAALGSRLNSGIDDSGRPFHPFTSAIVSLLCVTGCRYSEIASLHWSEVDFEQGCLRLVETKSGKSLRAIGEIALGILMCQQRRLGSQFVFPGAKGNSPYQGLNKEAPRLFRSAGLEGVSCHVLRHTFASVASGLGYSDGTIAGLLGHKGRGVTSRYIHRPDAALASAAQIVSSEIWKLLKLQTPTPGGSDNRV
ncbi:site-specific integrase [Mesorhizobium sp. CN2-181]|uniref:tyrosine-type recombinase/integrase n=1 Tax=Mesorhizobium yinganensis TaxID=3157707 RepID=UPI0032B753E4